MQVSGKVLVCDSIDQAGIDSMKRAGLNVDYKPEIKPAELVTSAKDYDVIIVRSRTKVTKEVVDATNAKIIARVGVGLDNVDVKAAEAKKIKVINAPEAASVAVGVWISYSGGRPARTGSLTFSSVASPEVAPKLKAALFAPVSVTALVSLATGADPFAAAHDPSCSIESLFAHPTTGNLIRIFFLQERLKSVAVGEEPVDGGHHLGVAHPAHLGLQRTAPSRRQGEGPHHRAQLRRQGVDSLLLQAGAPEKIGGVANGGDRHFVERTRSLLAVASDERNGRPFGLKFEGVLYLEWCKRKFVCEELGDVEHARVLSA